MKIIFTFVFVLILVGCSIGRSYHNSDNVWKLGYSEAQLNERVYRVSYAGHDIPQSECDNLALLRAAEITKKKGYKYFRILNEKQSLQSQFLATSGMMATENRPVSTITIEMLEKKDDKSGILDAGIIWNSLAKKYGVQSQMEP